MRDIHINNKKIGKNMPIFLIAEAGINHNGNINIAKKLIDIASEAEVDAIKFQTYITENLILKQTSKVKYQKETTDDKETFFEMIKKYELSKQDFKTLKNYCEKKEIIFLSTPFDNDSVEILEELNVPVYKIGSGDMNNYMLLNKVCSKHKPIFLSTGMATLNEVIDSVNFIKSNGIEDIVIFQCTSNYPTKKDEINLNVIDRYKIEFSDYLIGFSDHSQGILASIGAAAKGAKVIEKHFTLDKNMEGPDHRASMNPDELKKWVKNIRILEKMFGTNEKFPVEAEKEIASIARKSIISQIDLKKGDTLTIKNISVKRPEGGIPPKSFKEILGKKINKDIQKDTLIQWDDIQ